MNYSVLTTRCFERELKRLSKRHSSVKEEYAQLVKDLEENPIQGTPIGNNCYKIRLAISSKGKGKSGGARVITYLYLDAETVYLLTVYDKSEKANIETKELKKIINSLEL
jgi:mRNA-degrading endonuclease RelE of RelBE toxin-antitoxin system